MTVAPAPTRPERSPRPRAPGGRAHAYYELTKPTIAVYVVIVAVAAFNIVSALVMVVTDKQADIAILRTLGATPLSIMGIFMVQGSLLGVFGVLLGAVGGVALAINVPTLVQDIETLFAGGHALFVGVGSYAAAFLFSHLGVPPILGVVAAIVVVKVGTTAAAVAALRFPAALAASVELPKVIESMRVHAT